MRCLFEVILSKDDEVRYSVRHKSKDVENLRSVEKGSSLPRPRRRRGNDTASRRVEIERKYLFIPIFKYGFGIFTRPVEVCIEDTPLKAVRGVSLFFRESEPLGFSGA